MFSLLIVSVPLLVYQPRQREDPASWVWVVSLAPLPMPGTQWLLNTLCEMGE